MNNSNKSLDNTVSFTQRKMSSPAFQRLYDEGMQLVEATASYLDGIGREEAKYLSRVATSLYAAESMRLTTRLMQVSSWLLLQRAFNSGEMNRQQVEDERNKIRLDTSSAAATADGWEEMPAAFLALIASSLRLQQRVAALNEELYHPEVSEAANADNPVNAQINLLKTAFGD
ncbi:MAG: DUF1465 family protein [Ahrensia sp.]